MSAKRPERTHLVISRVNFAWYLLPIVPILVLFWLGATARLPSFVAVLAFFGFFMWLFSLIFALVAVWRNRKTDSVQ